MLKKIDNCIFCQTELKDHTSKKRFCSTNCRVYYNRELKRNSLPKREETSYTNPILPTNKKEPTIAYYEQTENNIPPITETKELSKTDILRNLRSK